MKSIIQFPHPGVEHSIASGEVWNTGVHKRKYLKVNGTYLKDLSSEPMENTLYFWGEWEAQSKGTPIADNTHPLPKNIFEPFYQLPIGNANTDPFVFGNQFHYCICKQGHYPTLRNLNVGDIILFGSNLHKHFVLDTVFVIKDWLDYNISDIKNLESKYGKVFYDVSLVPIIGTAKVQCKETIKDDKGFCLPASGDDKDDNNPTNGTKIYRTYRAVMYEDCENSDDIFSYAPCLPEPIGNKGFRRPVINLPQISQGLSQGIKIIKGKDSILLWHEITKTILEQNRLRLMIKNELPKKIVHV